MEPVDPGTPPLLTGSTSRLDCVIELFDSLILKSRISGTDPGKINVDKPATTRECLTDVKSPENKSPVPTESGAEDVMTAGDEGPHEDHEDGRSDADTVEVDGASLVNGQSEEEECQSCGSKGEVLNECEETDKTDNYASSSTNGMINHRCQTDVDESSGFRLNSFIRNSKIVPNKTHGTSADILKSANRQRKTGNVATLRQDTSIHPSDPNSASSTANPDNIGNSIAHPEDPPLQSRADPSDFSTDSGVSEIGDVSRPDLCDPPSSTDPSTTSDGTMDDPRPTSNQGVYLPLVGRRRDPSWPSAWGFRWRGAEPRPLSSISTTSSSSSGAGSLPRALVRRRNRLDSDVSENRDIAAAAGSGSRLSYLSSSSATSISSPTSPGSPGTRDLLTCDPNLTQADRVVAEIVQTEAVYVSDLRQVIEGYIIYLRENPEPSITEEHRRDLFNNFEDVYLCNRDLLSALERCDVDPLRVAECFVRHQHRFSVYTEYCTNYPRSVSVLTELMRRETTARLFRDRQMALGHTLPLGSYLLKPVQRILKYHLLLQSLTSQSAACSEVDREAAAAALQTMKRLADHINNMKRKHEHAVRVQEIQSLMRGWQGDDLTTYGELLAEETFRVPRAKMPRHVFLFELMLLITKRQTDNILVYKTHIMCSNLMLIESVPGEASCLQVLPFDNPKLQYTLQARTVDRKRQWALRLKAAILESYGADIPKHARELVMKLGQHRENGEGLRRRIGKRYHSVPDYLERRKACKRPILPGRPRRVEGTPQDSREERERRAQIMFNNYVTRMDRWSVPNGPIILQYPPITPDSDTASPSDDSLYPDWSAGPLSTSTAHCLPDLDEEGPDDVRASSGDVNGDIRFTAVTDDADDHISSISADVRSVSGRASSTTDLERDTEADLQTIVEQLVMQKEQFQRILDRPRRELRRSPTQSSSGTSASERDGDSCLDLIVTTPDAVSQESEEEPSAAISPTTDEPSTQQNLEPCEDERTDTIADDEVVSSRPAAESSRQQVCDALNIESHDNVEYVSLFDYGATSTSTTPVPPTDEESRDVLTRSVADPCRRVVRRIKDLRQTGQTEVRQLLRGIRSRSVRLSKHLEEDPRPQDTALQHPALRDWPPSRLGLLDEVSAGPTTHPRLEAGKDLGSSRLDEGLEHTFLSDDRLSKDQHSESECDRIARPVWRCDVLPEDVDSNAEEPRTPPDPSAIRWPTPPKDPPPTEPAVHRRALGRRLNHWRPLSLMFEPQKSRQNPPASIQHATSLERLNCSVSALDRRSCVSGVGWGVSASYTPSLTSLKSGRLPSEGGVRWLGKRVLQLILGDVPKLNSVHDSRDECSLGARLAAAADPAALIGPLQSPLLTCPRRQLTRTESVTSRGSSAGSSEADLESDHASDASGFYEHGMDILEHVDNVEVCWE